MSRIDIPPTLLGADAFAAAYEKRPELWYSFQVLYGTLWQFSTLDDVTKDMCRLKSAFLNGCKMCQFSRAATAREQGMDESMVDKVHHFRESDLPESLKAVLEFAERWILDRAYSIDDELLDRLKQHYSDAQLVELAVSMGIFEGVHKMNNAFDIDAPVEVSESRRPAIPQEVLAHLRSLGAQPRPADEVAAQL